MYLGRAPIDAKSEYSRLYTRQRSQATLHATQDQYVGDAKLIYDNCRKYNNETTPYAKSANKLEKFMFTQIRAIPEWSVSVIPGPLASVLITNLGYSIWQSNEGMFTRVWNDERWLNTLRMV